MTSEGGKKLTSGERSGSEILRCSFCNKSQAEVRKLIAGPAVFICDECVAVCRLMLEPEGGKEPATEEPSGSEIPRCSFCNKSRADVWKIIAGPDVFICNECVDTCCEILDEDPSAGDDELGGLDRLLSQLIKAKEGSMSLCRLCFSSVPVEELTTIPQRGALCRACIDAVRQATDS